MNSMFSLPATYTDLYQLTMAQVYFSTGRHNDDACFDYFYRKLPFEGGFALFAGLNEFLQILNGYRFSKDDLEYLKFLDFDKSFISHLEHWRFAGDIFSVAEGDVVFPNCPVLRVEGTLLDTQIIETVLLNLLNFQTLVATKAARIRLVAGDRILSDFGLRRAHGLGGYHATRAAVIGGFDSTSNVKSAMDFDLEAAGTMAHSFIQSYDDELEAFREFAHGRPDRCILLVDTYNTLTSGVPNAITVAHEMERDGHRLIGIRLDSGDLAYLAKRSRHLLDEAGLNYVKIVASNQLDEWVIKSLIEQEAPIDVFGVGTSLTTGAPDAALDGVYKLSFSGGKPRIKLSESLGKITLPDKKQVLRVIDREGNFFGADAIVLAKEEHTDEMVHPSEPNKRMALRGYEQQPLLQAVMKNGEITGSEPSLQQIRMYAQERLHKLPGEYKRFQYPHLYKVGVSHALLALRNRMKAEHELTSI